MEQLWPHCFDLLLCPIEFHISNDIKIEAPISAINTTDLTVTVLGITVVIDNLTILKDESEAALETLTVADLSAEDYVEISASLVDEIVVAGKVERKNPEDTVELQGLIDSAAQPDLVIMGVDIITDENTEFEDNAENTLTAETFFAMDLVGLQVEIEGVLFAGTLTALSIEIED